MIGWGIVYVFGEGSAAVEAQVAELWSIVEGLQQQALDLGMWFYVAGFGVGCVIFALLFGGAVGLTIAGTNVLGFLVAIGAVEAALTDIEQAQADAETELDQAWIEFSEYI